MSGSGWELMNRKLRSPPPLRAIQFDVGEQIETKPAVCALAFDTVERGPCRGGGRGGGGVVLHLSGGARRGRRPPSPGIGMAPGGAGPLFWARPPEVVRRPDESEQRGPERGAALVT